MKRIHFIIIVFVCTILVASGGTYVSLSLFNKHNVDNKSMEVSGLGQVDIDKIEKTIDLIQQYYFQEVDKKQLIEGAVRGMLEALNDPYSVYMDEEQAIQFNRSLESSFEGIGAEITEIDGKIIVVSPIKNSPAEKAGLKPYDQIIKIDGEDITSLGIYDVTVKLRGEKGTKVLLEVLRDGVTNPISIEITRDRIENHSVFSSILESKNGKVGYIEITSFSRDTANDFKEQLSKLEKENIIGLIIDVRGNPGGLLDSVLQIASQLVVSEKPLVQIESKDGTREQHYSSLKKKKPYDIITLVNKGSASASEILAATLQEAGGYLVIGERTFGKGTVQQQVELEDHSHIKLTMFKWLTPDGNWIHEKGINPNIHVLQSELYNLHPIQVSTPLKKDMTNEQIQYAQLTLKALGFEPGRFDGYFSNTTEVAVKVFQQENQLEPTGIIDSKTVQMMERRVKEELENWENDLQLRTALKFFEYSK